MEYIESDIFSSDSSLKHGFIYLEDPADINDLLRQTNIGMIKTVNQIHGDDFVYFNEAYKFEKSFDADAVITCLRGFGVGVYTADCVPIIFYDEEKIIWGVIHAGWRGTLARITEKVSQYLISKLGCNINTLKFAIGPCIEGSCYEIGEEIAVQFEAAFQNSHLYLTKNNGSKYNLDLRAANIEQLKSIGIKLIDRINICTMCDADYPSYRRDGKNAGRMLSFIGLV